MAVGTGACGLDRGSPVRREQHVRRVPDCPRWRRHPRVDIAGEWRRNRWAILQVGFFNITSYLLVLFALRTGTSSYVIALRQLSIAAGVWLGAIMLRERISGPKWLGVTLILAGCVVIGVAR